MTASIRFDNVCKGYSGLCVLDGLSFSAGAGEAVCLFGPSGSGKTTALRIAAGLTPLDTGEVHIGARQADGQGVRMSPHERDAGMVFQDLCLWPHMRALRHIDFVLKSRIRARKERRRRAGELLELCRLSDKAWAYPAHLSGGQRQRLAIARAIALNPSLLLLDEPLANLDAALRDHFLALFRARKEQGAVIVFATHDRVEADFLADTIVPF